MFIVKFLIYFRTKQRKTPLTGASGRRCYLRRGKTKFDPGLSHRLISFPASNSAVNSSSGRPSSDIACLICFTPDALASSKCLTALSNLSRQPGLQNPDDIIAVQGQRVRLHRLAGPGAGLVDAIINVESGHGVSSVAVLASLSCHPGLSRVRQLHLWKFLLAGLPGPACLSTCRQKTARFFPGKFR